MNNNEEIPITPDEGLNNNIELCKKIQNNIHKLCLTEIDEIFKILHKYNSNYSKNNNGVFINLNWLDKHILEEIDKYIDFCLLSQNEINKYEIMKNLLNDTINNKEKEHSDINEIDENITNTNTTNINKNKVSSSMKFYLLKKKFLKKNTIPSTLLDNILTYEEYIFI